MGKAGFLSFFVVLAESSSGVIEFSRNDGGHDAHGVPAKENGFARCAGSCRPFLHFSLERSTLEHSSNGGRSDLPFRWGAELVVS